MDVDLLNDTDAAVRTQWQVTVYKLIVPSLMLLCFVAFLANTLVLGIFVSKFNLLQLTLTLRLAFSLAASDMWTSLVVAASIIYSAYLPAVHAVHNDACVALVLEVVAGESLQKTVVGIGKRIFFFSLNNA